MQQIVQGARSTEDRTQDSPTSARAVRLDVSRACASAPGFASRASRRMGRRAARWPDGGLPGRRRASRPSLARSSGTTTHRMPATWAPGADRNVALVTIASVPSLPTTSGTRIRSVRPPRERNGFAPTGYALECDGHILDLAVRARALAGAPCRDPAANGAAENRRGKVTECEPRAVQSSLERYTHMPRLDLDERNIGVEMAHSGHPLEIDHDGPPVWPDTRADAAPCAERDDWDALRAGPAHKVCYFARRRRPGDGPGTVFGRIASPDGEVFARPEVACIRDTIRFVAARAKRRQGPREGLPESRHCDIWLTRRRSRLRRRSRAFRRSSRTMRAPSPWLTPTRNRGG